MLIKLEIKTMPVNCCSSFAVCGVLETVLRIEKELELVSLSPKDIFCGLIKENKGYEDGCIIPKVVEWAKSNGCILESSCRYEKPYKSGPLCWRCM
ncbi:hypothetical protein TSUD_104020 [Trifolium subterraneum]|uniref:Uncharacterized protein n=1 Tax=Trifolium subterraneum TaxID=3900 RepID=A0A2Z6MAM7_TRISU|nr:hypothetical protein TSUD_104020 [Trifolium subterraneum]